MPTPIQDLNHVAEALALLTEMFKDKTNVKGLLSALVKPFQDLENAIYVLLNAIIIANNPTGNVLDQLGSIVGLPRNGLDDATYLKAILIQIRVLISKGKAEDIIQVAALIITAVPFTYNEYGEMSFEIQAFNVDDPTSLAIIKYLGAAKMAGSAGRYRFTDWISHPTITWDDASHPFHPAGFDDSTSGIFSNWVASLQRI